ncbi:MAG: biotin transporter BioY [Phycisphaerales bacterium]|nr:biotin transporter BioY [Phycisphaerales bacterium]
MNYRSLFDTLKAPTESRTLLDTESGKITQQVEIDKTLMRLFAIPLFAMFTAFGAQIAVPTPPFGIPVTLQTLVVLLAAMSLGPRLGAASMILYLFMGIIGFGVFAEGNAGWQTIIGQTGGYLLGFIICQPVAHYLIKNRKGEIRGWIALFFAGLAVHMVIFLFGVPWLWWIHNIDPEAAPMKLSFAVYHGFVVFIPGMLLKSGIAAGIAVWFLPSVARKLW